MLTIYESQKQNPTLPGHNMAFKYKVRKKLNPSVPFVKEQLCLKDISASQALSHG